MLPNYQQRNSYFRLYCNGWTQIRSSRSFSLLSKWQVPNCHWLEMWGWQSLREMWAIQHRPWSLVRNSKPQCWQTLPFELHLPRQICICILWYCLVRSQVLQFYWTLWLSKSFAELGRHQYAICIVPRETGCRSILNYQWRNRHLWWIFRQILAWMLPL